MKKPKHLWLIAGLALAAILNIVVWSNPAYYSYNKGTEMQDLLFFFVLANIDFSIIIYMIFALLVRGLNMMDKKIEEAQVMVAEFKEDNYKDPEMSKELFKKALDKLYRLSDKQLEEFVKNH
jgi:uncharacterized membrane protein